MVLQRSGGVHRARAALAPWALGAVLVLGAAACAPRRPALEAWLPIWRQTRALLPERAALAPPDGRGVCERALQGFHDAATRVLPAPDENIERLVQAWLDLAQGTMYECPLGDDEAEARDRAYANLERLAREIDVAMQARPAGED